MKPVNEMTIGVVDIETTNFINKGGKICEVGVVTLTPDGRAIPRLNFVCQEQGLTPNDKDAWIFSNSDLTLEGVLKAPMFSQHAGDLQQVINEYDAITAFNKKFDFTFLRSRGIKIPHEVTCPMLAATPVCKLRSPRGGYKWPKVEEAWQFFFPDIEYVELHRGSDDAEHEALLLFELIKLGVIKYEAGVA